MANQSALSDRAGLLFAVLLERREIPWNGPPDSALPVHLDPVVPEWRELVPDLVAHGLAHYNGTLVALTNANVWRAFETFDEATLRRWRAEAREVLGLPPVA